MDGANGRTSVTLVVMVCVALVVAVGLVSVMYFSNYDSPRDVPLAQGPGR